MVACGAPAGGAAAAPAGAPAPASAPAPRPLADGGVEATSAPAVRFLRRPPPVSARRGVDACAYASELTSACIDALVREPDPTRAKYMRRIADARAARGGTNLDAEIAECCNAPGTSCGAQKTKGHADCPVMDDGFACLVAAERENAARHPASASAFHARACECDWRRGQIPIPGGTLACDAQSQPAARRLASTAADTLACATCESPAACEAEQQTAPTEIADFIARVVVQRCQLP